MTVDQITSAIISGNLSNDELNRVILAVTFTRNERARQAKRTFKCGDTVKWSSTKLGRELRGSVTKIAIKYVTVRTQQGLWKVPANMLEAV